MCFVVSYKGEWDGVEKGGIGVCVSVLEVGSMHVNGGGGTCVHVLVCLSAVWECVYVCCGTRSQASLVCEVRREKSGVPQHASTSSCSICPFRSVLHKLKTLYICFGVHC